MKVGLITPNVMSATAVALADSLRESPVGLAGIIGLGSALWMPAPAAWVIGGIRRYGLVGTLMKLRQRPGNNSALPSEPRSFVTPSMNAALYARKYGIRYWRAPAANHPLTASLLRRAGLDTIVSHGAGILRPVILDVPGVIFINAHAGRLPKYGGMNVVEWAVYNNDPVYGTVHRIDRGIDTGDILAEAPLALERPTTIAALRASAASAVWGMVSGALTRLANGELNFCKQPENEARILWYRMHPELLKIVQAKLDNGSFFLIQERCLEQGGVNGTRQGRTRAEAFSANCRVS